MHIQRVNDYPATFRQKEATYFLVPRSAFSLVELLVVIAVIVILIALLLPAISASRASSRAAQCAAQLEQVGAALTKADLARVTAQPTQWITKLSPYLDDSQKVLHCADDLTTPGDSPGAKTTVPSYGLNSRAFRMSGGDSHKIVMLDYKAQVASVVGPQGNDDWPTQVAPRHRSSLNVLFSDGSVQRRKPDEIDPRVCDLHDRLWRPTRDFTLLKPGCSNDVSLAPPSSSATTGATTSTTSGSTTAGATTTGGTTTGSTTGSPPCTGITGSTVRVRRTDTNYLHLAEVQVFGSNGSNVAPSGTASQSSTYPAAVAPKAIDGSTDGNWGAGSIANTNSQPNPWWRVDLAGAVEIHSIVLWNRIACCPERLTGAIVEILDSGGTVVWSGTMPNMTNISSHPLVICPLTGSGTTTSGTTTGGTTTGGTTTGSTTGSCSTAESGLCAEYRKGVCDNCLPNPNFTNDTFLIKRVDPTLILPFGVNSGGGDVKPQLNPYTNGQVHPFWDDKPYRSFTSQWTGQIYMPASGTYRFQSSHDDQLYIWIDGRTVHQRASWTGGYGSYVWNTAGPLSFSEGWHDILIQHIQNPPTDNHVAVRWESTDAGIPLGDIPPANLRPPQ